MKTQNKADHPAQLLFNRILNDIRTIVQSELTIFQIEMQKALGQSNIPPKPRRFYTIKEAATELNVSKVTVRRLIDRGLLRPNRTIRHIRIAREQIDEFVRNV